jgi:hypothetical protein
MNEVELYNLMIFNYYVLFKTEHLDENYKAIVPINNYDASQTTHIWDKELDLIIPALWYILHLPRMGFDVIQYDIELLLHSHDEPHNIIPVPYCISNYTFQKFINRIIVNPTLIICTDEIYDDIIHDQTIPNSLLGICKVSELTTQLMQTHWKKLSDIIHKGYSDSDECIINPKFRLSTYNERKIIPLIPLANQFGLTAQLIDEISELNYNNNSNKYVLGMRRLVLDAYRKLIQKDAEFKNRTENGLIENPNFNGVPLVITMPGIMKHQIRTTGRAAELPSNESELISILGYHRAMAKNALYIECDSVSQEMYTELASLEEHCKDANKINNIFIWRTLRRIGKLVYNKIKKYDMDIIEYVSQITVFSDFPIGLAILPNCSAPLCCIKPISYRPITPLTKAYQYEVEKSPQVYFGKRLKVVVAECVEKSDHIRKYCDGLTRALKDMAKSDSEVELVVEDISSIGQFKQMLKKHNDADILLISAHGTYQIKNNMAGLVIGNSVWMADDNDIHFPPVVLLSACHVMPRGRGVVSVGDTLIRSGAKAVLGTFIPIDVRRNATLIVRLFTDILEVRKGWSHMSTLDEIWSHVVCSNAIHEIIASTSSNFSKLEIWANTKKADGTFPQSEFKSKYSVGRIRNTHTYEDTENILREIACRDGIGDYYNSYLKSNGYFPESLFYQFIGTPENIFLRNEVVEQWDDMNK